MTLLRIGLVGAGRMGAHHARHLAGLNGVRLAGIADADQARAAELAARWDVPALADAEALARSSDALVIAASSAAHAELADLALALGKPVLVEKPLALDEAAAAGLVERAARAGLLLAVGHVERFNPATAALAGWLDGRAIQALDARRFNPGSARILDASVVADLMIHDLDVMLHLAGTAPTRVAARGDRDHAVALFGLGAAMATASAGRGGTVRARALTVWTDGAAAQLDFAARQATVLADPDHPEPLAVDDADPLRRELAAFAAALGTGDSGACVTGAEALEALRLAWAIEAQLAG